MPKSKEAAETKVVTKKRVTGVSKDAALTVNVTENVKREGSKAFDRFAGYLTDPAPATVQEALDNGLTMGDINYDIIAESISVEGAEVEEYTPTPRAKKDAEVEVEAEAETADEF